ncbi:hypothetical protein pb186bvf_011739 [Paramecium bursaria]
MSELLYDQIDQLSKLAFHKPQLEEFYKKITLVEIFQVLKDKTNYKQQFYKVVDFISALLEHPNIYKDIITSDQGFFFIENILGHQDKKVRYLIGQCIDQHSHDFIQILEQSIQQPQYLNLYLQAIFYQLVDPESDVGLKQLRVAKKLFKKPSPVMITLITCDMFSNYIIQGLTNKNEIIQLRFVELLIYLSNQDPKITEKYLEQYKIIFNIYKTDDILVKLNMIEIMSEMGNSKATAQLLLSQPFFKDIIKEAFSETVDFYVRKYQVILFSKLLNQRVQNFNPDVEKKINKLLLQWFTQNSQEEIEGALEVIKYLASFSEGLNSLCKNRDLLLQYFQFFRSTKDIFKKKFLSSFIGFFEYDQNVKKQPGQLLWIYSQLGNTTNQISFDIEPSLVHKSTETLMNLLTGPFPDIEQISLELLKNLIIWEDIFKSLIANDKFKPYFIKYSQNKEIYDLKNIILEEIFYLCEKQYKADQYISFVQDLKNQKQQQNMQYEVQFQ